ncbi:hypothetical protein HNW77_05835 [Komagataeibacter sp. AV436]|uniref:Porin n=1 Tax=Komagataeibacter melomenusus TaxID=2766578 RepID=A0ABX2ADK3_9PROT|nr:hypothetical protein [Komagataeibacter melomenusus]MBV1830361.1 hypothetical protein [Komagataeibacter melomenusus]NPC65917.1 hypothetical protein [Komagataeibacter melomenusus]
MQIPFLSGKPAARLASLLMLCSVLVPVAAAWGDEDPESLDVMERQMAHLQEQQQALQNELAAMHQQIAQHRARLGGTSAAGSGGAGHPLEVTGSGGHVRGGWVPVEGHAPQRAAVAGGERVGRPHIGGYSDPTSELGDQPTVESVVAHREEDLISHMANNNVGPHNRETVGAQSAGALGSKVFHLGPVAIILGGFFDAAALVENRQVSSGIFNYWNAIPFRDSSNFHTTNFNGDARYSRFSLMARGQLNPHLTVAGFVETDFGASAETTNPYESNSYVPRLRQAYLTLDDSRANTHFLIGQAWTMLTPDRVGIVPRQESLPETIESSILAGQTWSRQWQVRIVKDFLKHRLWTGLSIENPATIYDTTGFSAAGDNGEYSLANGGYAKLGSNGVGLSSATTNYSNEIAPDIIGKLAWDPAWGHYEVEGVVHFPHDRSVINGVGENHTAIAWGVGGSMILPVIPHRLEVRLAGLAGKGIGRYGSVLLPDATLRANGAPALLSSAQTTAGVIAHPNKVIDVYGYFGMQRSGRSYFDEDGGSYGYGNPNADNTGCMTEGSDLNSAALGGCTANIRSVEEFTIGAWYRFIHGQYGTVQAGTQLAYSRVHTWGGMGGAPTTSLSEIFFDFRYLPFQ